MKDTEAEKRQAKHDKAILYLWEIGWTKERAAARIKELTRGWQEGWPGEDVSWWIELRRLREEIDYIWEEGAIAYWEETEWARIARIARRGQGLHIVPSDTPWPPHIELQSPYPYPQSATFPPLSVDHLTDIRKE